ncbi:MAG: TfoX/Sxy family protein [Alphaproteobacteria bacterium]
MTREFLDYILELLEPAGYITSRRMFSGYGIYKNNVVFALIADGVLYFKVDDRNRADYESHESAPFTYARKDGKVIALSYWEVPLSILEERASLLEWVEKSYLVSLRTKR